MIDVKELVEYIRKHPAAPVKRKRKVRVASRGDVPAVVLEKPASGPLNFTHPPEAA